MHAMYLKHPVQEEDQHAAISRYAKTQKWQTTSPHQAPMHNK